jgi:hypothetical protein
MTMSEINQQTETLRAYCRRILDREPPDSDFAGCAAMLLVAVENLQRIAKEQHTSWAVEMALAKVISEGGLA